MPVSMLGIATPGSSASGASGVGAYAGLGINVPVTTTVSLGASVDGSARSDGTFGGAARVKLAGSF